MLFEENHYFVKGKYKQMDTPCKFNNERELEQYMKEMNPQSMLVERVGLKGLNEGTMLGC
jgi:hypothetical protein